MDDDSGGNIGDTSRSVPSSSVMAAMALALTGQEWMELGHGENPNVEASTELTETVHRVLALFVVRIVALVSHRQCLQGPGQGPCPYADLSTTTICQTDLARHAGNSNWTWPIAPLVISQLRTYIERIFLQYKQVSYHNFQHAYHVIISANKLLDLMLHPNEKQRTYGLKSDPLSHVALLFSALVHDVEHQGVPNRQLVFESDALALLYNDQSVAEQRSLAIAFAELTRNDNAYNELRNLLFDNNVQEYRRFRKTVINLVLTTDIASPERTQVVKSKWKEAFGERKVDNANAMEAVRLDMEIKTSSDGDGQDGSHAEDDEASETSTSVTPESCEGLDSALFDSTAVAPLPGGSTRSNDGQTMVSSGQHQGEISSPLSYPTLARTASTPSPSRESILPSMPSTHDAIMRSRAVSSEERTSRAGRNRESGELQDTRAARRFSMPTSAFDMKKAHVRLGIRRTLDLTGEAIEPYIAPPSAVRSTKADSVCAVRQGSNSESELVDPDDPDELRASVVMEHLLKAADVAANMQGWDQLVKWSSRLFFEQMDSFATGRGEDPRQGWFQNQITFLESYMLPLARRLYVTQVFGGTVGRMFARIVEENRDRWISEGAVLTTQVTQKWIMQNESSGVRGGKDT